MSTRQLKSNSKLEPKFGLPFSFLFAFLFVVGASGNTLTISTPMPNTTPGKLCTPSDPDFTGYDYSAKVARCARKVDNAMKAKVAEIYGGIPENTWSNYEFDHLIPLCAGGANAIENLWPQPLSEAQEKDKVEVEVCTGLREGTLTQEEGLAKIHAWFSSAAALK